MPDNIASERSDGLSQTSRSARYALAMLTIIYTLNFLDRTVITILIDPIKRDFQLSDKAMGFISGFGFVIMYSILAAPVARWADRGNRRSILTWGLVIWSGMTALAGIARNALQLTLARFGVGIGEAAGTAPSASMISDLFPDINAPWLCRSINSVPFSEDSLARSSAAGSTNISAGTALSWWLACRDFWSRSYFASQLRSRSGATPKPVKVDTRQQRFWETLRFLLGQKSYMLLLLGFCLTTFTQFGFGTWAAPFLHRIRHLDSKEIGTYLGTVRGVAGLVGTLIGGYLTDWFGHRDPPLATLRPRHLLDTNGSRRAPVFVLAESDSLARWFCADLSGQSSPRRADRQRLALRGESRHAHIFYVRALPHLRIDRAWRRCTFHRLV